MLGYQSKCSKLCNSKWATLSKWFSDPVSFCMKIIFLSKFAPRLDFWISLFQNFRLYSATIFPQFWWGIQSCEEKRMETLQILSEKNWRQSPKMPSVFILEGGRPPPWPSWWGALSGWVPRTAWKCSWWKPSPCTADPCRYLTGRLKMGKWNSSESEISSENVCENSIWSESSCKGAIWDRATGAEKLKVEEAVLEQKKCL